MPTITASTKTPVTGQEVRVYYNLHKRIFSVMDRHSGRVITHLPSVTLRDATFTVRPGGRERVLAERRKNVHAFVNGTWDPGVVVTAQATASYNPYRADHFVTSEGEPITRAEAVVGAVIDGRPVLSI
jgi:hypothetical protein